MVLVDVLAINVRNRFWGPDSELFKPARFKTIKQSDVSCFRSFPFQPTPRIAATLCKCKRTHT